jgi:stage II sporulation protein AA (anti-sigma F factor antagonist)
LEFLLTKDKGEGGMTVTLETQNRVVVARLKGELDSASAPQVRKSIDRALLDRAPKSLVVDLSELTFMDSSGIGVLIGRYKLISGYGGSMSVCGANRQTDKLLTLSGVRRIIKVYENEKLALDAV